VTSSSAFDTGPGIPDVPTGAIVLEVGADYQGLVDAAPDGATFVFAAGVHRLAAPIEPKDGQVFIGGPGAVLNGARELSEFERAGGLYVAAGQTQRGERIATDEGAEGAVRAGFPETFFIDDRPLRPVASIADVTAGAFFFDYPANRIYFADDPAGHVVEAGFARGAFAGDAQGVTISNLVVEMFDAPTQRGAIQGGEGWIIENNEVRLNYGVGITVQAGGRIVGNDVHDNGQMGLGGNGANILVEGNTIHANGFWSGIDQFWEGGGAKFALTQDLVVRGNYSYGNHGFGLWTDIDNVGALYEGNLVVNNDGGGITHEISYEAIIRGNTLIGNGTRPQGDWLWGGAIQIQNSQDVQVYGNRIDMSAALNGIALIQQDRGSGAFGAYTTTNNHVHDNILVSTGVEGASGGAADFDEAGLLDGGNVFADNRYFMPDGDHWWWGDFPLGDNWAAYQAATDQDEGSTLSQAAVDTIRWITSSPLTAGDDDLRGAAGADLLVGGRGRDALDGAAGADTLIGGKDDDAYRVDSGKDRIIELAGEGHDSLIATASYAVAAGQSVEVLRLDPATGSAALNLTGNELANTLIGNAGANALAGGGGDDVLRGGPGRDALNGGGGSDMADYAGQTAAVWVTLAGAAKAAVSIGGVREDALRFIENVIGGAGDDRLTGDAAANLLSGGAGGDWLAGGGGADTLAGGAGRDTVSFGDRPAGADIHLNGKGRATVADGDVTASISGIENVVGGAGGDDLEGNASRNVLNGGAGADRLDGGGGRDVFVFRLGEANLDQVEGFDPASGDRLVLVGFGPGATLSLVDDTASGGGVHLDIASPGHATERIHFTSSGDPAHLDADTAAYATFIAAAAEYMLYL
jgi:Ca2+-binding RTX toxin-like protein